MTEQNRRIYDCDTHDYWCSEADYENRDKTFGNFIEDGKGYQIFDPNTPRPWLNYFANSNFGSVISNTGLGFTWYRSTLLRITKYEHPIDYLPRDFKDGREIIIEDLDTAEKINVFREGTDLICTHFSGRSTIEASALGMKISMTVFVPVDDPCEIWLIKVSSSAEKRHIKISFQQTWCFAKFGIHTAEDGIPYISTPGKNLSISNDKNGIFCKSLNDQLPYDMHGFFMSPQTTESKITPLKETRPDGRSFTFNQCELTSKTTLDANTDQTWEIISGVTAAPTNPDIFKQKYSVAGVAQSELQAVIAQRSEQQDALTCTIPDKNLQYFLNVWFKNQLKLVFHFVRSGQNGYRDSLQDAWGWAMIDANATTNRLVDILSHQCADGTAPRQFSAFEDGEHDMRRFMDSPVWISKTLIDLVKESGDTSILERNVPFLDGSSASVNEHVWRALDYLYQHRGQHGLCLTGDGDWNDALEGISKDGDAVSTWLTIAMYDAMKNMIKLYDYCGNTERANQLKIRTAEIKQVVNDNAWDGKWYVYGFTGSGKPIGSKDNREGKIHLNAQTWAVFSGIADEQRAKTAMTSVKNMLGTDLGPMLMFPAYVNDAAEVGRIANLEPGTFENASIYQHAVTFAIFACISNNDYEGAYQTMVNLLPTNPENFDCRRTSEPYCTGNYYCGAGHPRFGQNFFTWFTGNAAWLLRAGFDGILGVKAGFDGLEISPKVPASWNNYEVQRRFRGCLYNICFNKTEEGESLSMTVDGVKIDGNIIPITKNDTCNVSIKY
jgi:cellobiose phosphorylase/N,N'-diacetylchitobiose phosphorylase